MTLAPITLNLFQKGKESGRYLPVVPNLVGALTAKNCFIFLLMGA